MEEFATPDCPAALFDAMGRPIPGLPLRLIGLGPGESLPSCLRDRLDRDLVPYRAVPVAVPGFLALFDGDGVIQGADAVSAWLDREASAS